MELQCTLDIIESLNNGSTFEEVKIILDNQGHSGMSYSLVLSMLMSFYDKGEELFDYLTS